MGERLRVHLLAGRLQDPIVADRLGGAERLFDLALTVEQAALGDRGRPRTGEAVGLQLRARR